MTFQQAYLIALHGVDQTSCCLWTSVSPLCILSFKYGFVCIFSVHAEMCLFLPFPSLGSLSLWIQHGVGMVGQEAVRPVRCH